MLCEKCNLNPANTFATINLNNKQTELYLCEDCAGKHQNTTKLNFFSSQQKNNKACICNTKFQDILQSGYVGCAECYNFFEKELTPIITALHTKPFHTGKKKLSKLEFYTAQLEKARENNFHSLAEKLILKINTLKGEESERI